MMAVAMGHQRAVLCMTLADAFLITGSRDFTIKVQANGFLGDLLEIVGDWWQ